MIQHSRFFIKMGKGEAMYGQSTILMKVTVILMLGLVTTIAQPCAAAQSVDKSLVKEKTEQLYLNYDQLDSLYKDLREITSAYIYKSDQQLNYMQKIALYINEARLTSYYQWQMLSVIEYIKPAYLDDYYTLRKKDLLKAIKDLDFLLSLLDLYTTYIDNKAALQPVEEAVTNIKGTIYLFEGLVKMLRGSNYP